MKNLKFVLSAILISVFALSINAAKINTNTAYQIAERFNSNAVMSRSGSAPSLVYNADNIYVFNYTGGGFVVISSSSLTDEILGYSKEGTFDKNNIPVNMKSLLQSYSAEIEYAEKNNINAKSVKSRSSDSKSNIEPLIKSKWDQGYPYNLYCPEKNGQKCLTGCVATAMAQVMAYHKSEYKPTGTYYYYGENFDLDTCSINYDNLCTVYQGDLSDTQKHEIAKLIKICGYFVKMGYGTSVSKTNTYNIMKSLTAYFDYNENDAKWAVRTNYNSQDEWEDEIYNSLKNSCPVPYRANCETFGHAFICDGYEEKDGESYFHMNWGWSGGSDGYFKLSSLIVNGQDFNSKESYKDYSKVHCAIVNLHPNILNNNKESENINVNGRTSITGNNIVTELHNISLYSGNSKYGFLVINENNDSIIKSENSVKLQSGQVETITTSLSDIEKWNLDNDIYKIIPVVSRAGKYENAESESEIYVGITPFKSILSDSKDNLQTLVDAAYKNNFKIEKLNNLKIKIQAVNPQYPVFVFNLTGQLIYKVNDTEITLPKAGMYTIKNGKAYSTIVVN